MLRPSVVITKSVFDKFLINQILPDIFPIQVRCPRNIYFFFLMTQEVKNVLDEGGESYNSEFVEYKNSFLDLFGLELCSDLIEFVCGCFKG